LNPCTGRSRCSRRRRRSSKRRRRYVGGTTLLTTTYRPGERSRAQAANDLSIYVVGLAASLSAGALLERLGGRAMNVALLPWLLFVVIALVWLGRLRASPA
jgi:hypothetical protein